MCAYFFGKSIVIRTAFISTSTLFRHERSSAAISFASRLHREVVPTIVSLLLRWTTASSLSQYDHRYQTIKLELPNLMGSVWVVLCILPYERSCFSVSSSRMKLTLSFRIQWRHHDNSWSQVWMMNLER
jgi:hypothetical protein